MLRKGILFIVMSVACTTVVHAQDEKVEFGKTQTTVGEMIDAIKEQTRYVVAFEARILDTAKPVRLDYTSLTVTQAMDKITEGGGYEYFIRNRFIVVGEKERVSQRQAAEPVSNVAVTGDVYSPGDRNPFANPNPRPAGKTEAGTVPVQAQEIVEELPAVAPAPYSNYLKTDYYSMIGNRLPRFALRTNLLYGAAAFTPNLAFEFGVGTNSTLAVAGSFNNWNHKASTKDNKKLMHWTVRPEYRYWFCERYDGHFIGADAFYAKYNIGEHKIPMLFKKEYRYDGWAVGAGFNYGYHLALSKKWGLEFTAGVGVAYLKYDRFACTLCNRDNVKKDKIYVGPTRAAINLVFLIK